MISKEGITRRLLCGFVVWIHTTSVVQNCKLRIGLKLVQCGSTSQQLPGNWQNYKPFLEELNFNLGLKAKFPGKLVVCCF